MPSLDKGTLVTAFTRGWQAMPGEPMMIRIFVLVAALTAAASIAAAQGFMQGTPEEQAACRPDVRRFCHSVVGDGNGAVLACLKEHREKLHRACRKVLVDNGQ
ncbi:MAG: cysteine rich repeat-containing protein [Terriglobia bacterium]